MQHQTWINLKKFLVFHLVVLGQLYKFGTTFKQFKSIKGQDLKVGEKVSILNRIIGYDMMDPHTAPNPHWASRWLSELMTTVIKTQMPSTDI
jgi:hypothetical protein